jgi:recombination protein RecA
LLPISELYERLQAKYVSPEPAPSWWLGSGSLLLDKALGGGYPGGRIIEIYGDEGTGKTTLGLHAMVEAQRLKKLVVIIDAERAFDEDYAAVLGLRGRANKDYLKLTPEIGEHAFEMLIDLVSEDPPPGLIVVDSVAALVPKAELEGDMGEAFMGLQARLMSQGMRKTTGPISSAGTVVIFINQTRSKIGVFFGSPNTTTGGRALKFYTSQRIELHGGEQMVDSKKEPVGRFIKVKVVKNKVAMPLKTCQLPLVFGRGISRAREIFDLLQVTGKIVKKTSWYFCGEDKLGLGELNSTATIEADIKKYEKML